MNRIKRTLLAALAATVALGAPAIEAQQKQNNAQKLYDVEVIIFKNVKVPRSHEINLPIAAPSRGKNSISLSQIRSASKSASKAGFVALDKSALKLSPKAKQINQSGRYELLLHSGWRQPGLGEKKSIAVFIRGGKIYPSTYSSIDQFRDMENVPGSANQPGAAQGSSSTAIAQADGAKSLRGLHELEGLITISLSRYLHTHAQLVLRKPASTREMLEQAASDERLEEAGGGILVNHMLDEKRRMRSRKLHYLDHPQFGMLVLITPYEPNKSAAATEDSGDETTATNAASSAN